MSIHDLEMLEYQEFCLIAANDAQQEEDIYGKGNDDEQE